MLCKIAYLWMSFFFSIIQEISIIISEFATDVKNIAVAGYNKFNRLIPWESYAVINQLFISFGKYA